MVSKNEAIQDFTGSQTHCACQPFQGPSTCVSRLAGAYSCWVPPPTATITTTAANTSRLTVAVIISRAGTLAIAMTSTSNITNNVTFSLFRYPGMPRLHCRHGGRGLPIPEPKTKFTQLLRKPLPFSGLAFMYILRNSRDEIETSHMES